MRRPAGDVVSQQIAFSVGRCQSDVASRVLRCCDRLIVSDWSSVTIGIGLYDSLDFLWNVGEEVVARQSFNLVHADTEVLPVRINPLRIRHDDGDSSRRGSHTRNVIALTDRKNKNDLP